MIKKIAVATLWVQDFQKAITFYQEILGLELLTRPGEVPHFKIGDGRLVLLKGKFCPPSDAFPPEFAQLSFEVENLEKITALLQKTGVPLKGHIEERRDSRWVKFCDPDGNLLELVEIKSP